MKITFNFCKSLFFFLILSLQLSAQLSGSYTINSLQPSGGTNYQSFTDFVADINLNGVSGPVVVSVVVGSGPYTEQVALNSITGVSNINTITLNGNDEMLQFMATDPFPDIYTLKIASNHVKVNRLHVKAMHGTNGCGIYITNNATNVSIDSCTIEVTKTNAISSAFGILVSGATSYLLSGSLSDSLAITNNTIIGGYSGIQLSGEGFTSGSTDPVEKVRDAYVANNNVLDFYATGIWLSYTNNALVTGNRISRPTRTNSGSDSQTPAGITVTSGSIDFILEKNRIYDFAAGGGTAFTSIARGIYVSGTATALTSGTIRNNLIYNLDNDHSCYGMQINSWSGLPLNIYHNTIAIDQTSGTTVSPPFPNSGYHTVAMNFGGTTAQSNINVMNNIFFVRRDGDVGKRMYYISNNGTTINSDYNVFYYDGLGQGETDFGYKTVSTQFLDLTAWQATGQDSHSIFADPQFTDPSTGNFVPTNPFVSGDSLGTPSLGVIDDILGNIRGANPDPGAFEIEPCGALPVADFSFVQDVNNFSFTNTSTGATSYLWQFGSPTDTSTVANPSFTFSTPGNYTVTLIVTNDCGSDTFVQNVSIINNVETIEIIDASLYPNPSNGITILSFNNIGSQRIKIDLVDVTGRVLKNYIDQRFTTGDQSIQLDCSEVPPGIYAVRLDRKTARSTLFLVIER